MTVEQDKQREIDRLHATIEQECQALNAGLQGLTGAARHTFVSECMKIIGTYADELTALVGSQAEALTFTLEQLAKTKQAPSDAPPTFLQVGLTMIAVAHIATVDQIGVDTVIVHSINDRKALTFCGEEAALFLELFQAHSQIVTRAV